MDSDTVEMSADELGELVETSRACVCAVIGCDDVEFSGMCAVVNCGAALGAPRDRNGFCERCADELEAIEREERAAEVDRG
jgi:hypothetical protein